MLCDEQPARVRVPATNPSQGHMASLRGDTQWLWDRTGKEGDKGDADGSEELARVLKGLHLPLALLRMSNTSPNPFEEQY